MALLKVLGLFSLALLIGTSTYFRDSLIAVNEPRAHGKGVVFYDRFRIEDGYNMFEVYFNWGQPRCTFLDMQGHWLLEIPGTICALPESGGAISSFNGITRWNSELKVIWNIPDLVVHHEIFIEESTGRIYAWAFGKGQFQGKEIETDQLLGFESDGKEFMRWKADEHLADLAFAYGKPVQSRPRKNERGERLVLTHFNSIQVLPENSLSENPTFKPGNLLISDANCNCWSIMDPQTGKFIWTYRPEELESENVRSDAMLDDDNVHTSRMLANGHIVYFHNNGSRKNVSEGSFHSEVIEINPLTKEVVSKYRAPTNGNFFAQASGSSFRLKNGNTIVSHLANGGGAFEITANGKVVWDWENSLESPVFPGEIYRVERVPKHLVDALISIKR